MPNCGRALAVIAGLLAPLGFASAAHGWASVEHQEIGASSYARACAELRRRSPPAGARRRGRGALRAGLRREPRRSWPGSTATRRRSPATSWGTRRSSCRRPGPGGSAARSTITCWRWRTARTSTRCRRSRGPSTTSRRSPTRWRRPRPRGSASVEQLQLAMFESAFADHYLQDSFAAGHMGFNRAASSAAAAKSFHDAWNARGRVATDRAGHRWVTFGDGRLDEPGQRRTGRRHVIEAATLSVRGVLTAFVLGARAPDDEIAVWQILPFTIEAPELLRRGGGDLRQKEKRTTPADRELVPLELTIRPAHKDMVATASFWSAAPFTDPGDPVPGAGGRDRARHPIRSGADLPRRGRDAAGARPAARRGDRHGRADPARAQRVGAAQPPAQRHRLLADPAAASPPSCTPSIS